MRVRPIAAADGVAPPAGGSGATAGGWADATARDAMIASVLTLVTQANSLKAELNAQIGAALRAGIVSDVQLVTAADAVAMVAGGTGNADQSGCYDGASNRDLFITRVNAMRTLAIELSAAMDYPLQALKSSSIAAVPPYRAQALNVAQVTATALAAGGTGAVTGSYDTAANRNTSITRVGAIATLLNDIKAKLTAYQLKLSRAGVLVN